MFCTKCGKQVPDGSVICPHCGNALAAPQQAAPQAAPQPLQAVNNFAGNVVDKAKKGDKKTLIIGAVAAVAAVIVLVMIISWLFGNGPKSVVKKALKKSENIEKKYEELAETYLLFSNKKARKKLDMDNDEDEEEAKTSWKITKTKKYGKNDDVTEGMRAYVSQMGGDEDKVKASALVEVTETTKVKGEDPEKVKKYYAVVKVGGKWYMLTGSGSKADNINKAADKWEAMAGSDSKKKKNSDDDDD